MGGQWAVSMGPGWALQRIPGPLKAASIESKSGPGGAGGKPQTARAQTEAEESLPGPAGLLGPPVGALGLGGHFRSRGCGVRWGGCSREQAPQQFLPPPPPRRPPEGAKALPGTPTPEEGGAVGARNSSLSPGKKGASRPGVVL